MALSKGGQLQGEEGLQTTAGKWHVETKQQRTLGKENVVSPVPLIFNVFV